MDPWSKHLVFAFSPIVPLEQHWHRLLDGMTSTLKMASTVYDPEICASDIDGSVTKKENGPVRINRNSEHR